MNNMFPKGFRPMKGEMVDPSKLSFKCTAASTKIDGYRLVVGHDGLPYTSSLKPFKNKFIVDYFKQLPVDFTRWLDGEIVVGDARDPDIYSKTTGPVKRADGKPDFTFHVFDMIDSVRSHASRFNNAVDNVHMLQDPRIKVVPLEPVHSLDDFWRISDDYAEQGYEGTMIRNLASTYKFGRSTVREGGLLKWKLFDDYEAEIIEVIEEQENTNTALRNELGLLQRSSHSDYKRGKNTAGAYYVRGLNGRYKDMTFPVSLSTMKHLEKYNTWVAREKKKGVVITFSCLRHDAGYTLPRGAKYKCERPEWDMSDE